MRLLEAASLSSSLKSAEKHREVTVEKYLDLSKSPGYKNVFDGPDGTINGAARVGMLARKREARTDVGMVSPASTEKQPQLLGQIESLIDQSTPVTQTDLVNFTSHIIDLIGGVKLGEGEKIAELPIINPGDENSSILLHTRKTKYGTSANISWKNKQEGVTRRVVVGNNFAESLVGDHPSVINPYNTVIGGRANTETYTTLHSKETDTYPVTLFDAHKDDSELLDSQMSVRAVMETVYQELPGNY